MNRAFYTILAAVLPLILAAGPAAAETKVEIFRIYYSNAAKMAETVKVVLSPEGKVSVNQAANAIVVVDRPEVIEQVKALVAQLDRELKNIRINVDFVEKSELEKLGADFKWTLAGPGWRIGTPGGPPGKGARATIGASLSKLNSKKKQTLLVMEGRPGKIFVGEQAPLVEYFHQYGYSHGYISKKVKFKSAGASFNVVARTVGEGKIKIKLEPEVSYYDRGKGSFVVKNAATTLVVGDPGTAVIASSDDNEDSFNANFLRGIDSRKGESSFAMILSVSSE